jgi:hypothetical protein
MQCQDASLAAGISSGELNGGPIPSRFSLSEVICFALSLLLMRSPLTFSDKARIVAKYRWEHSCILINATVSCDRRPDVMNRSLAEVTVS